jgi:predicted porin
MHAAAQSSEPATVTCVSDNGARRHCEAYTDAGIALRRSTGAAACLLGRNWGYDADGVWVTEGCGAEFVLGNSAHEQQRLAAEDTPPTPAASPTVTSVPLYVAPRAGEFSAYSRLGVLTAMSDDEAQVQDSGSRVRFEYASGGSQRFFAAAEWAVNLTTTASTINPGETTDTGFVSLEEADDTDVFGARLGYVGADLGKYGTLTIGKQWSVYYDVTGYTDAFNAFGGEATATYNSGTDGGYTGTGRADGALVYRKSFLDALDIGLQVQMRDLGDEEFFDGYGLSARVRLSPRFELGASYIRSVLDTDIKSIVPSFDDDPEYRSAGLRYHNDNVTLGIVYAEQTNGDLARVPSLLDGAPIVLAEVFDAKGVEVFGRYQLGAFGLIGGFLHYSPHLNEDNVLIDPRMETQYGILGFDYRPAPRSVLYAEYRAASGADVLGVPGEDVFVVGAKYEFAQRQRFD